MKCKAKVMVSPSDVPRLVKPCSLASSLVAPLPSLVYNMPLPLTLKGSYLSIAVNSSLVSLAFKNFPPISVSCPGNTAGHCISEIMVFLLAL